MATRVVAGLTLWTIDGGIVNAGPTVACDCRSHIGGIQKFIRLVKVHKGEI